MKRIICFVIIILILGGCAQKQSLKPTQVKLVAVGDNLMHDTIAKEALSMGGGDTYDYSKMYVNVKREIERADIAIINQETPIGGSQLGVSGYPNFNSPYELGQNLIDVGFDVINQANNHILDKGKVGIKNTLDYWRDKPVKVIGVYNDEQDKSTIKTITKNNITFSLLAYTFGTNGITIKNTPYGVYYIDEQQIISDIARAKTLSDAVIVFLHWGEEYQIGQNQKQKELAQKIADAKADLIIAHHPHVIQPVQKIDDTVVYYSLGNFISNQIDPKTMLGAMAQVTFEKDPKTKKVSIISYSSRGLVTHYESKMKNTQVYFLDEYTNTLAKKHGIRKYYDDFSFEYLQGLYDKVMKN